MPSEHFRGDLLLRPACYGSLALVFSSSPPRQHDLEALTNAFCHRSPTKLCQISSQRLTKSESFVPSKALLFYRAIVQTMALSTQNNGGTPASLANPYMAVALNHSLPHTNTVPDSDLLPYDDVDDAETIGDTSPVYDVGYDIANPPATVLCDIPGTFCVS